MKCKIPFVIREWTLPAKESMLSSWDIEFEFETLSRVITPSFASTYRLSLLVFSVLSFEISSSEASRFLTVAEVIFVNLLKY
jgi:hypothetical protein